MTHAETASPASRWATQNDLAQSATGSSLAEEYRREELIRTIEHALKKLTLQELEALLYDMSTRQYITDQY